MILKKRYYKRPLSILYHFFGLICFLSLFSRTFLNLEPETLQWIHTFANIAMFVFLVEEGLQLLFIGPKKYIAERKLESAVLILVASLMLNAYWDFKNLPLSPQDISLAVLGIAAFLLLTKSAIRQFLKLPVVVQHRLKAHEVIFLSFIFAIAVGTFLLKMPGSTYSGVTWIDAFFTATSAVCVTGLSTLQITKVFTPVGLTVIMLLFQIGGLGIMTISMTFASFLAGRLGIGQSVLLKKMFDTETIHEAKSVFTDILRFTLFFELIGFGLLALNKNLNNVELSLPVLFECLFHSVSAFCNAGFSLYENSLYSLNFGSNLIMVFTLMFLIVSGGLGFPVVINLFSYFRKSRIEHHKWQLSTHSKLVLASTAVLLFAGFLGFYFLESDSTFANLGFKNKAIQSLFLSVTSRTAGFNLWPTESLTMSGSALLMILMWIGGAPISTAGGIKCTTVSIAAVHMFNQLRGKNRCEIFKREISPESIQRALTVIFGSLLLIFFAFISLVQLNPNLSAHDLIFETFSAWGTVGLSRGVTDSLSSPSKLVIIFMMFCGRVGFFSVFSIFLIQYKKNNRRYLKDHITVY